MNWAPSVAEASGLGELLVGAASIGGASTSLRSTTEMRIAGLREASYRSEAQRYALSRN